MNIIEAINSGKPFRRRSWSRHYWADSKLLEAIFNIEDVLADDWEIKLIELDIKKPVQSRHGKRAEIIGYNKNFESEFPIAVQLLDYEIWGDSLGDKRFVMHVNKYGKSEYSIDDMLDNWWDIINVPDED